MKTIQSLRILMLFAMLMQAGNSLAQQVPAADLSREKEAIRAVVAKETEMYYRQDYEGWRSTFVNAPYFRMHGYWESYPEKVQHFEGFEALAAYKKKQFEENRTFWTGSTEERAEENFRIYPYVAWYTFEQTSYDKNRKLLGKSLETRILEKHDGQWKIAYLGFQYLPLATKGSVAEKE